jgi:hypothetical protein
VVSRQTIPEPRKLRFLGEAILIENGKERFAFFSIHDENFVG